jgi:DNA-binding PadR family transcriptional regulator
MHPEFDVRADSVKNSVLITPDVNMYELSSNGVAVLRDDWSSSGRKNLQIAIMRNLKDKQCNVKFMETETQTSKEMAEVRTLYKLVHKTMDQHAFGPHQKTIGSNGFEYSLGSLETILQKLDADSLIFVTGYDQVSKEGRKAMLDLAIADSSGTILYYSVKGTTQGKDLRDPASTAALVRDLLSSFSRMEG